MDNTDDPAQLIAAAHVRGRAARGRVLADVLDQLGAGAVLLDRILTAGVYGETASAESQQDTRGDAPARAACWLTSDAVRCITTIPEYVSQGLDLQI